MSGKKKQDDDDGVTPFEVLFLAGLEEAAGFRSFAAPCVADGAGKVLHRPEIPESDVEAGEPQPG